MIKASYRGYKYLSKAKLAFHIIFLPISIFLLSTAIMWYIPSNCLFIAFLKEIIPEKIQEGIIAVNPFLILLFSAGVVCLLVGLFGKTTIIFTDQEIGEETNV